MPVFAASNEEQEIEQRAGVRQECHQTAMFNVAKKHHIDGGSYAAVASKMPKKYVMEIVKEEEECVLKYHSKHPNLQIPSRE